MPRKPQSLLLSRPHGRKTFCKCQKGWTSTMKVVLRASSSASSSSTLTKSTKKEKPKIGPKFFPRYIFSHLYIHTHTPSLSISLLLRMLMYMCVRVCVCMCTSNMHMFICPIYLSPTFFYVPWMHRRSSFFLSFSLSLSLILSILLSPTQMWISFQSSNNVRCELSKTNVVWNAKSPFKIPLRLILRRDSISFCNDQVSSAYKREESLL